MNDLNKRETGIVRPKADEEVELRRLLRPRRQPPNPSVKGLQWVMTGADFEAFGRVLCESFPSIVFYELIGPRDCPQYRKITMLANATNILGFIPPPDWCAEDFPAGDPRVRKIKLRFTFWRSNPTYSASNESGHRIEFLRDGAMYANYFRTDGDTARFLRRVWRASEKITTKLVKEVDLAGRTLYVERQYDRFGFGALRWCQEDPMRRLNLRYRPTDDWSMPDSPYYA